MPLPAHRKASFAQRQAHAAQEEAWKRFGYHSEAGRLLRQLYGGGKERFRVRYPKVKKDESLVNPREAGIWRNLRSDQVDPKSNSDRRAREKRVHVPKPRMKRSEAAKIDCVPRRKSYAKIQKELGEVEREVRHFRPKATRAVSTETEKRRLALCNQFKGGKGVPQCSSLCAVSKNIPLHLVTGKLTNAAMKTIEAAKREKEAQQREKKVEEKRRLEQQFEDVSRNVEGIQKRIEACQGKPNCTRSVGRLRQELSERFAEMQRIDEILQAL